MKADAATSAPPQRLPAALLKRFTADALLAVGLPAKDAATIHASGPSAAASRSVVRSSPVRAPIVVSVMTFIPRSRKMAEKTDIPAFIKKRGPT